LLGLISAGASAELVLRGSDGIIGISRFQARRDSRGPSDPFG